MSAASTRAATEPIYRVHFKNYFARGGGVHTPDQRAIDIHRAKSRDRAIQAAKKRFARREGIADWQIRASIIEVEEIGAAPAGGSSAGDPRAQRLRVC